MAGERYVALGLARVRSPVVLRCRPVVDLGLDRDGLRQDRLDRRGARPPRFRPAVLGAARRRRPSRHRPRPARGRRRTTAAPPSWSPTVLGPDWVAVGRRRDVAHRLRPDRARGRARRARPPHRPGRRRARPGRRSTQPIGRVPGPHRRRHRLRAAPAAPPSPPRSPRASAPTSPTPTRVVLADLALHADQAMLHDARDVIPGVLELVESHRSGDAGRRRGPRAHLRHRRTRATGCCSACAATATGPRSGPVRCAPRSTGCARRSRSSSPTSTTTSRARRSPARPTSRTATSSPGPRSSVADVVVVVGRARHEGRPLAAAGRPRLRRRRRRAGRGIVPVVNRSPRRGTAPGRAGPHRHRAARRVQPRRATSSARSSSRSASSSTTRSATASRLPDALVDPVTEPCGPASTRSAIGRQSQPVVDEPVPVEVGSLGAWDEEVAG